MITPAELPINHRGGVYHLDLRAEELADTVITVGDPARVSQVSHFFDSIELKRSHREFLSHTGFLGSQRITVISTGIGMPNMDIVMSELDALVNIDLNTRTINQKKKQLTIIRLGTTGGVTKSCSLGDIVISRYAVGFDTLLNYYQYHPSNAIKEMEQALTSYLNGNSGPFYISESCPQLATDFSSLGALGITATCGGFYGPQGRQLRAALRYPDFIDKLSQFEWNKYPVINIEMETAALYALGNLLGHRCLSISVVVANRPKGSFADDIKACLEMLITKSLFKIKDLQASSLSG